jgi:hypothetical protein
LIGAGGGLESAGFTLASCNNILGKHTFAKRRNALQVAVTAAYEGNSGHSVVFIKLKGYTARANAFVVSFDSHRFSLPFYYI